MPAIDFLLVPWRVYLVLVLVLVAIFAARRTHPIVTIAVLTRFSWVVMIVQFAIGIWALFGFPLLGPSLFKNLFVLSEPLEIALITTMSLVLTTGALVTFRTTRLSAVDRFGDYADALGAGNEAKIQSVGGWRRGLYNTLLAGPDVPDYWHWRWFYLVVVALPLVGAAAGYTYDDFSQVSGDSSGVLWRLIGGFAAGVGCWAVLVLLATLFQQMFLQGIVTDKGLFPFDRWRFVPSGWRLAWLDRFLSFIARQVARLGPGYAVQDEGGNWRLQPGHAQLAFFAFLLSVLYLLMLCHGWPPQSQLFSALFALLTMLLIVTVVATGAAFFLDYFRLPLVLSLVAYWILMWTAFRTDSYYSMGPPPHAVAEKIPSQAEAPPLPPVGGAKSAERTLVVVAAAGGGILASAWTAEVLTGLQAQFGDNFTKSIGLVSSVSGGSVGAMFFLDRWSDKQRGLDPDPGVLDFVRQNAMSSSLEATAQGMAGWDTVKTFIPIDDKQDRGYLIEDSWRTRLFRPAATMADWAKAARENRLPIVVFNATAVEDGKRMMISNCLLPDGPGFLNRPKDGSQAVEYGKLYNSLDLSVATAARLSATFPYVSPICRPRGNVSQPYHVADGGYVDNEGVATALDWLDHLLGQKPEQTFPFKRILFIRIVPFGDASPPDFHRSLGWFYALFGPLEAIVNERSTSQHERNELSLALFRKACDDVRITFTTVDFQLTGLANPPLSWKLSQYETKKVGDAWKELATDAKDNPQNLKNPINVVRRSFE
jgi:hypothetical protein